MRRIAGRSNSRSASRAAVRLLIALHSSFWKGRRSRRRGDTRAPTTAPSRRCIRPRCIGEARSAIVAAFLVLALRVGQCRRRGCWGPSYSAWRRRGGRGSKLPTHRHVSVRLGVRRCDRGRLRPDSKSGPWGNAFNDDWLSLEQTSDSGQAVRRARKRPSLSIASGRHQGHRVMRDMPKPCVPLYRPSFASGTLAP
jgi:hypothetical protein